MAAQRGLTLGGGEQVYNYPTSVGKWLLLRQNTQINTSDFQGTCEPARFLRFTFL